MAPFVTFGSIYVCVLHVHAWIFSLSFVFHYASALLRGIMIFYLVVAFYLQLVRHGVKVFQTAELDDTWYNGFLVEGVDLIDSLYTRERFEQYLVVSACQHESEVCKNVEAAFGILSSEIFVDDNVEYSQTYESFAELESVDWYTFYRLDFEL